jgi:hypothetical protein
MTVGTSSRSSGYHRQRKSVSGVISLTKPEEQATAALLWRALTL